MPTKSDKQARTMRAAAHDPAFAKKMGIPTKVAKEFVEADKKKAEEDKKKKKASNEAHSSIRIGQFRDQ